ncbi:MAG: hypothetical protein A2Y38_01195 [Spirochaetes bacterium GWB1_59_5]|nr:MAG: hypothetical protein A2Y38_01195 [Spirochaetes bacterium GWB1_59_5]
MQIHLSLRRKGDVFVYGIPLWYRISSAVAALALTAASIFSGGLGIPGSIIVVIVILAAFYQERWTFDAGKDTCTGRMGLVFAAKGPTFKVSDIAWFRIDMFAKGRLDQKNLPAEEKMPGGSQARLIVEMKNGETFMLDSVLFKRRAELEAAAQTLAEALGIPLR